MNPYIARDLAELSPKCLPQNIIYQQVNDLIKFINKHQFTCFSNACDTLVHFISTNYPDLTIEKITEPNINPRTIILLIDTSQPHLYNHNPRELLSILAVRTHDFRKQTSIGINTNTYSIFNAFLNIRLTAQW